jgi:hypothetical protein
MAPHARSLIRSSFFIEELWGSAPRARQGKAPANAGADPSGLPVFRAFSHPDSFENWHALVQTRSSSGPLTAGDPPPLRSPWRFTARVTENVYDSPTGLSLLIPQGTRLIGAHDSQVAFGQSRVLLVWTRLIMPNGRSIVLEHQPGRLFRT